MRGSNSQRLSAVLFADVEGYSRLMLEDEAGTLQQFRQLIDERVRPLLSEHAGRLVKTTGDGFIAEFSSAVAAVECAVAIQNAPKTQQDQVSRKNHSTCGLASMQEKSSLSPTTSSARRSTLRHVSRSWQVRVRSWSPTLFMDLFGGTPVFCSIRWGRKRSRTWPNRSSSTELLPNTATRLRTGKNSLPARLWRVRAQGSHGQRSVHQS